MFTLVSPLIKDTLEPEMLFRDPLCYFFMWFKLFFLPKSSEGVLFYRKNCLALESSVTLKLIFYLPVLEVIGRLLFYWDFFDEVTKVCLFLEFYWKLV